MDLVKLTDGQTHKQIERQDKQTHREISTHSTGPTGPTGGLPDNQLVIKYQNVEKKLYFFRVKSIENRFLHLVVDLKSRIYKG